MRLGELLLGEGLVTTEGLEEALESQVIHGGRLGTNLVELGLLQEKDLARLLGKQHNCAFAAGEMVPDPKALALVDANFADDKDVLPMRVDATRLSLAVLNPADLESLDALAFKTGKRVVPVVIPEFRMNQLLRRYCKAFRPMRAIDMNTLRPSKTLEKQHGAPEQAKATDLMSEDEFNSLYAQALSGGRHDNIEAEEVLPEAAVVAEVEAAPPAPEPVPAAEEAYPPTLPDFEPLPVQESPPPVAAPPPVAQVPAPPPAPAPEPPPTPLTFAQAQALLSQSSDREDIARTVLRFALGKWKRALLLSVQGQLVVGWQGVGKGVRKQAVQRIAMPLRPGSTFKLVCDTRSFHVGPIKRDGAMAVFYKLLGAGYPTTAVLLPLLVRGNVVHILYVDNGPDQLTPPDVGELLILSQSVGRSYEQLFKRRKSA